MQFRGHDFGVELLCLSSQKGYVKNDAVKLSISSTSHLLKILSGKHNLEIKMVNAGQNHQAKCFKICQFFIFQNMANFKTFHFIKHKYLISEE